MPVAAPNQKADQFPKAPASAGAFGRFAPRFRAPEPAGPFAALAELAGRPLLWAVLAVLVSIGRRGCFPVLSYLNFTAVP